jgi:hypothetical protein
VFNLSTYVNYFLFFIRVGLKCQLTFFEILSQNTPYLLAILVMIFNGSCKTVNVLRSTTGLRRFTCDKSTILWVLEPAQVKSTWNRRACIRNVMTVEEARGVCKNRSKWKEVISVYPKGVMLCMYECMYVCMYVCM